jgi:hypothetical protein
VVARAVRSIRPGRRSSTPPQPDTAASEPTRSLPPFAATRPAGPKPGAAQVTAARFRAPESVPAQSDAPPLPFAPSTNAPSGGRARTAATPRVVTVAQLHALTVLLVKRQQHLYVHHVHVVVRELGLSADRVFLGRVGQQSLFGKLVWMDVNTLAIAHCVDRYHMQEHPVPAVGRFVAFTAVASAAIITVGSAAGASVVVTGPFSDWASWLLQREAIDRMLGTHNRRAQVDNHRPGRAALSVGVWVPLFSGVLFTAARFLFQIDHVDTIVSARRRRSEQSSRAASCNESRASSFRNEQSAPLNRNGSAASSFKNDAPQPETGKVLPPRAAVLNPAAFMEEDVDDELEHTTSDANAVTRVPPTAVPRLDMMKAREPSTDVSIEDNFGEPLESPPTAARRKPDRVSVAVVTTCSLMDVNACLTAAAKYGARQVIVLHGCGRRSGEGSQFVGATPRGPVEQAPQYPLAHVTSRTLEFIGRFQRTVHLSEVAADVELADFIRANQHLHGDTAPKAMKVVTVAVHRNPVRGATYLRDFQHPQSAVYCFKKDLSSPRPFSPVRERFSPMFTSPLKIDENGARGATYSAYQDATSAAATNMEADLPAYDELAFCDAHVYVRDDANRQTLAALVNVVLYDRAVKMGRDAARGE